MRVLLKGRTGCSVLDAEDFSRFSPWPELYWISRFYRKRRLWHGGPGSAIVSACRNAAANRASAELQNTEQESEASDGFTPKGLHFGLPEGQNWGRHPA